MSKADEEGSEKDRKSAAVTENTAAQEKLLKRPYVVSRADIFWKCHI